MPRYPAHSRRAKRSERYGGLVPRNTTASNVGECCVAGAQRNAGRDWKAYACSPCLPCSPLALRLRDLGVSDQLSS